MCPGGNGMRQLNLLSDPLLCTSLLHDLCTDFVISQVQSNTLFSFQYSIVLVS